MALMQELLQEDGHRVVTAEGGQAGIEAFAASCDRGEPFDAVITDLGMPHVGGRQVAEAVKVASPDTPVIMLTGWGGRLSAEGSIPPGVSEVLSKPLRLADIRGALARVTRRHS